MQRKNSNEVANFRKLRIKHRVIIKLAYFFNFFLGNCLVKRCCVCLVSKKDQTLNFSRRFQAAN